MVILAREMRVQSDRRFDPSKQYRTGRFLSGSHQIRLCKSQLALEPRH